MNMYGWIRSTGDVLRVHKNGLIMKCIRIFRYRGELNVVFLFSDFWIDEQVKIVV